MAVDKSVILKLEKLAKLNLDEDERKVISNDLDKMLSMVDKLREVDTTEVEPLIYMHEEVNRLRIDELVEESETDALMKNAKHKIKNYFTVPKVISK